MAGSNEFGSFSSPSTSPAIGVPHRPTSDPLQPHHLSPLDISMNNMSAMKTHGAFDLATTPSSVYHHRPAFMSSLSCPVGTTEDMARSAGNSFALNTMNHLPFHNSRPLSPRQDALNLLVRETTNRTSSYPPTVSAFLPPEYEVFADRAMISDFTGLNTNANNNNSNNNNNETTMQHQNDFIKNNIKILPNIRCKSSLDISAGNTRRIVF